MVFAKIVFLRVCTLHFNRHLNVLTYPVPWVSLTWTRLFFHVGTCISWQFYNEPIYCFHAPSGDRRVNQNLGIAVFQNMFLRFHNAIANRLYGLNPFWCDETVYQETRRIVIAVIQHITYTYYLPVLLGKSPLK